MTRSIEEHSESAKKANMYKMSKKLLDRDLTIRYLVAKFEQINKTLKHCRDIVDNKPLLYKVSNEIDRLEIEMTNKYGRIYHKSLSEFKRLGVMPGICAVCGKKIPDDAARDCCDKCLGEVTE